MCTYKHPHVAKIWLRHEFQCILLIKFYLSNKSKHTLEFKGESPFLIQVKSEALQSALKITQEEKIQSDKLGTEIYLTCY